MRRMGWPWPYTRSKRGSYSAELLAWRVRFRLGDVDTRSSGKVGRLFVGLICLLGRKAGSTLSITGWPRLTCPADLKTFGAGRLTALLVSSTLADLTAVLDGFVFNGGAGAETVFGARGTTAAELIALALDCCWTDWADEVCLLLVMMDGTHSVFATLLVHSHKTFEFQALSLLHRFSFTSYLLHCLDSLKEMFSL